MFKRASALWALGLVACTDLSLPDNALVSCEDDTDCPSGLVCRTQLSRCVDPSLLDQPVIAFSKDVTLSREVASRVPPHDVIEVTFALNRRPRSVTLLLDDASVGQCELDEAGLEAACSFSLADVPEAAEGVHGVSAIVEDELANRARDEASVRFDFTPPSIPADTVWLRLRAAPDSALRQVTAVGTGGAADLQFAVSEILGPPAIVTARSGVGSGELTRDDVESVGLLELHRLDVDGALPDGAYTLEASLVDPVGNAANVVVNATLGIDTTPPAAPSNEPTALLLHRAPWGSDDSGGVPTFGVSGAASVVESGAVVIVSSGDDALGVELGRATAALDGSFDVPLLPQDLPRVYASAVDSAGNRGPASLVRGAVWRATLGRKVFGESFANPHTLWATGRLHDVLRPPGSEEVAEAAAIGGGEGQVEARTTAAWRKVPLFGSEHPPVMDAAVVFDRSHNRALLFGGAVFPYQSTTQMFWERVGERWRELTVDGALPPARRDHAMVWDANRRRAVLFGGGRGGSFDVLGDTWLFDGARWREIAAENGPSPRKGHALVWDPTRGVVVLFGGSDATGTALDDTWELVDDTWVQVSPTPSPSARLWHTMAWDDATARIVLFGGASAAAYNSGVGYGDTWVYDGSSWEDVTPSDASPAARLDAVFVADERRGVVVLMGGRTKACAAAPFACTDGLLGDTWEWDGGGWSELSQPLAGGTGAAMHAGYYDPIVRRVFLAGGFYGDFDIAGEAPEARLYERTARGWARRLAHDGYFRESFAFTYDATRDRFVAHSGVGYGGAAFIASDVQEFDGESWSVLSSTNTPTERLDHSLAFVPGLGSVMLGAPGTAEATWRWTGGDWLPVSSVLQPRRSRDALVWDAARSQLVLFGGDDGGVRSDETWTHGTNGWALLAPTTKPSARDAHALAFDAARGVVVLFGGTTDDGDVGDTWEWDGTTWVDVTPAEGPVARRRAGLVYDPVGARVLLFGGATEDGLLDDAWAWDGAAWSPLEAPSNAGPRSRFGVAWDPVERRLALHSGDDGTEVTASDHWVLEPGHEARAAVIARFVFDASGAPSDVVPTRARVRAVAGGAFTTVDGSGAATAHAGVSLRAFTGGRWRELASAAHADEAPGLVEATVSDVTPWLGGEGRALYLAVTTTKAGSVTTEDGTRPGVVVRYLEIELQYTLP